MCYAKGSHAMKLGVVYHISYNYKRSYSRVRHEAWGPAVLC